MTILRFQPFGGLIPKADPAALPPSAAQVAANCRLTSGQLEAFNQPSDVLSLARSDIQTIYRFGQNSSSETQYWFQWPADVNCVKGAVANDATERTFYTGDGFPKQTNATIATSSPPYPSAFRRIGLPPPASEPVITAIGAHASTATPESRVYIYTFVSDLGEESPPSPASALLNVYPASSEITTQAKAEVPAVLNPDGSVKTPAVPAVPEVKVEYPAQTVSVLMAAPPSGQFVVSTRRLYRSVTGSSGTDYLFVAELPAGQTSYIDAVGAAALGEVCPTIDSALLPDTARGLVAMPNGIMLAHTDYDVYVSEAFKPYSYPESYINTVDYPIVGLGVFGTSAAVLTKGFPYVLTGTDPQSMALEKLPVPYACLSKRSICTAMGGVIYAAADGLVQISGTGVTVLTDALYTRREWNALNPSSMLCAVWDEKIFIFYDNGTKAGLILDMANGLTSTTVHAQAAFTDPVTGALFLVVGSKIVKWDGGAAGTFTWKSRKEILPMVTNFSFGQILASAYPLTAKIYADGVLKHTATVTSELPFRLPAGFKSRYWEVEISGSGRVFSAQMAESGEELQRV